MEEGDAAHPAHRVPASDLTEEMAQEFEENENKFFTDIEMRQFHMVEKRIARPQILREYGLQIRELFQAEIDIRQNRIMKILTIVTTIFLPLTLVAGWYGMNFSNMPELSWKYGYPAVIVISLVIVMICLWIMKKKKNSGNFNFVRDLLSQRCGKQ